MYSCSLPPSRNSDVNQRSCTTFFPDDMIPYPSSSSPVPGEDLSQAAFILPCLSSLSISLRLSLSLPLSPSPSSLSQAAFIRNPDYPGESAGPEIVTLGHNPYQPNVVRSRGRNMFVRAVLHRITCVSRTPPLVSPSSRLLFFLLLLLISAFDSPIPPFPFLPLRAYATTSY